MQQFTQTRTATSTMTAARVRNVMIEVSADLYGLVPAKLATYADVTRWAEELTYILENEAAIRIQIQLRSASQPMKAVDYEVSADGSLRSAMRAGGLDFLGLPAGTTANLFVELNDNSPKIAAVRAYLAARGWGTNGVAVRGAGNQDRSYSSEGYGVRRNLIGGL